MNRKEKIKAFIESDVYVPMGRADIMHVLGVPEEDKPEFVKIMDSLEDEGSILLTKKRNTFPAKREDIF